MSIEHAILELAKAINFHAEVLSRSNEAINSNQKEVKVEITKAKKPKKIETEQYLETTLASLPLMPVKNLDGFNIPAVEKPEEAVVSNVSIESADTITSEMCKNLAKEKMAIGVDRTKIKGLITEMGAESIADLTDRNLVEFYTKLEALK